MSKTLKKPILLPLFLFLAAALLFLLTPKAHDTDDVSAEIPKATPHAALPEYSYEAISTLPQAEAVEAARQRVEFLAELAASDPVRAVAMAFQPDQLAALPPEVRQHCEQPFGGVGTMDLVWRTNVLPDDTLDCTHSHTFTVDEKTVTLLGPDFTSPRQPVRNLPLQGWLLGDGVFLASRKAAAPLSPDSIPTLGMNVPALEDPVTGEATNTTTATAALIAGVPHFFASEDTFTSATMEIERAVSEALQYNLASPDLNSPFLTDPIKVESSHFPSEQINVLFIRVDFSDFPGAPISQADLETALSTVNGHLSDYSYDLAGITSTVTPVVYRMPDTGTFYAQTGANTQLINDARAAAAFHHTLSSFDVVAVYFPNLSGVSGSQITYGGLASVGGSNHWINGLSPAASVPVIVHEFGHNYGLFHANYWNPSGTIGGSRLDPDGNSVEYGDIFDIMGSGNVNNGYFSPAALDRIGWLPSSKLTQPVTSGVHRIYRFDSPDAINSPTLALRVPATDGTFYWIAHRQLFAGTAGRALVVNKGLYPGRPNLIDATPGSQANANADRADAALPVGQSFSPPGGGFTMTTLASGGDEPYQWIDVDLEFEARVELGATTVEVDEFAGNAVVAVRRLFDDSGTVSVTYSTAPGTADEGADYLPVSGTITWPPGDSDERLIRIPIVPDSLAEGPETFTLNLSDPVDCIISPAFSTATITILNPGNRYPSFEAPFMGNVISAMIPLEDGSMIIAGSLSTGITGNIARLHRDGSLDTSFLKTTGFNGAVNALLAMPDGSMIAGGNFTTYNDLPAPRIARLLSTGALDTDFSDNLGTSANGVVHALARETSGRILVGGDFDDFDGFACQSLVRLNANGSRDTVSPITTGFSELITPVIRAIHPETDGKITVTGTFIYPFQSGAGFRASIARLHANGSRDATFEPGHGLHDLGETGFIRNGHTLLVLPEGGYLVGGFFNAYNQSEVSNLIRITNTGALDGSFAPPTFNNTVNSLLLQANSRLLAGGFFSSPAGRFVALQSSDGSPDTSWEALGGAGGDISSVRCLAEASDGSVLVGGNFFTFGGQSSRPVVRLAGGSTTYDLWRRDTFTPAQLASGLTGPNDDFDGDGFSNLMEMIAGSDPTSSNSTPAPPEFQATRLGNGRLAMSLQIPDMGDGLWVGAQFSDDLVVWQPANPFAAHAVYEISDSSEGFIEVTEIGDFPLRPRRFVRGVFQLPAQP